MKHQPEKLGQTTTRGTLCATLCEKYLGSLTSPANQYREDAGARQGLRFIHPYPRMSYHLHMSLQRQHILLSYFMHAAINIKFRKLFTDLPESQYVHWLQSSVLVNVSRPQGKVRFTSV